MLIFLGVVVGGDVYMGGFVGVGGWGSVVGDCGCGGRVEGGWCFVNSEFLLGVKGIACGLRGCWEGLGGGRICVGFLL